jgi:hypothetical protein
MVLGKLVLSSFGVDKTTCRLACIIELWDILFKHDHEGAYSNQRASGRWFINE